MSAGHVDVVTWFVRHRPKVDTTTTTAAAAAVVEIQAATPADAIAQAARPSPRVTS